MSHDSWRDWAGATLRHPVSQNAIALYAVQFVVTVLPLVTLPWMARALGPSELGVILFTQSFAFLAGILIEYGFNLSATRRIARERDDPRVLAATAAQVQAAKLSLVGAATAVALIAAIAVPEFRADPRLPLFGWAIAAVTGLTPVWFFIGVERLRVLALVDVTVRVGMAAAIVLLVTDEGHGIRALWIWTLGSTVSLVALSALMYRQVPFERPSRAAVRPALTEGWPLFVTTASVSLYTSGTVFVLGLVTTSARLAMFAAAERVARVALRAISPLSAAAYPRVSHLLGSGRPDRAQQLSVFVLAAVTCAAILTTTVMWLSAPTVVRLLFGERFAEAAELIRVIALILPCVAVTSCLSGLWLLTRGLDRPSTIIAVVGAVSCVALTPIIGTLAGPQGVAWLLVAVEATMAVAFVMVVRAKGLAPTRAQLQRR